MVQINNPSANQYNTQKDLEAIVKEKKAEIHRLKSIIENLPGSIYWKDRNGVYLGHNVFAIEKMKSVDLSDSIIGKTDYDLFPKEVADQYRQHDLEVMEQQCVSSKEETVLLATGATLTQLSFKRPLFDEQNNIIGIIGNTIDITYLKKIETELREAKEKAERANQSKIEMIRHMEHDIRTPFSGIWVMSNMLELQEQDTNKRQCLNDISKSAKELIDYFNTILEFIKTETSAVPVLQENFSIRKLLNDIVLIETVAAKSKQLKLELDISEKVPSLVVGDPIRINRILLNLVSNAIKFTEKGYIRISAETTETFVPERLSLCLTVEDTGIGMPFEKKTYIQKHSTHIDYSEIIGHKKDGLGLPIVKKLIGELQGEIDVESETGKGTKFICTLPLDIPVIS